MNLDKPHNLFKPHPENGDNFPYLTEINEIMQKYTSWSVSLNLT